MSERAGPEITAPLADQPCQNCGDSSEGNYCRICGQHKIDHSRSLRALFADTVEDLSLTSELPRTLRTLVFKPGMLTLEYSAGRIARYIPPVRLYLAASLVFFLTLSFVVGRRSPVRVTASTTTTADSVTIASRADSAADTTAHRRTANRRGIGKINTPFPALNARLDSASKRMSQLPPGEAWKRIQDFMVQRAPLMMSVLLPVFALLLKLVFWRTRRTYTEHLVFALHTHALTFLVFALLIIMPDHGVGDVIQKILMYGLLFYQILALKRVYAQGWIRTLLKYGFIFVTYTTLFTIALIIEIIVAFLMAA